MFITTPSLPNLLLSLHPDYVMTHTLWPRGVDRTEIVCEWLFHPDAMAAPGFDPDDAVAFWDMTNRQDWHVCEQMQLGLASRAYRPGPTRIARNCCTGSTSSSSSASGPGADPSPKAPASESQRCPSTHSLSLRADMSCATRSIGALHWAGLPTPPRCKTEGLPSRPQDSAHESLNFRATLTKRISAHTPRCLDKPLSPRSQSAK